MNVKLKGGPADGVATDAGELLGPSILVEQDGIPGVARYRRTGMCDSDDRLIYSFESWETVVRVPPEPVDQSDWPAHLRDDARFKTCDTCGRKNWSPETRVGTSCGMPQPSGPSCEGHFVEGP